MNIHSQTTLKKSSGLAENYSALKFKRSLKFTGLEEKDTEEISKVIEESLSSENLTTVDIFNKTKEMIFNKSHIAGFKYSLKNAILQLGPSGFAFEKFIARALETEKYLAETDILLEGRCVRHEVDIRATKENSIILAECKFHNSQETKNDLKVALYVKARMDDLKSNLENKFDDFFLISNTSFSSDAIKYANCAGLKLLGFNYPVHKNLYHIIEENKYYPITCLPWLKKSDVAHLLDKNIILIHDLYKNLNLLKTLNYDIPTIENFKLNYEKHLSKVEI
jgi:hypothetical protein